MLYAYKIYMTVNNIQFTKIEIQIAKYLFKNYKNRYNARQLAKLLDINHAYTNKLCNILADKKLLVREKIGNSIFFYYDYDNKLAIKFMEYILSLEEEEFPKWLSVLLHSLKKFNSYIDLGLVFGSSIITTNFKDIDVLIIYDTKKSKYIKKIKDEIRRSELIERPIRYVDITEKDILLNKENKIFYDILSHNLIFYNPEKYVNIVKKCRK